MGSRRERQGKDGMYVAAQAWVDRCLRADGSLFTPDAAIWTPQWLGELRRAFLDNPGDYGGNFYARLQAQLAGGSPEVYQLMGEVLFVHFLIISRNAMTAATKKRNINLILGASPKPAVMPDDDDLVNALPAGITHPGQFFAQNRPAGTGFIVELAEQLKEQRVNGQIQLLDTPWEFKSFAEDLAFRSALLTEHPSYVQPQRNAIYHLVFPDTFEGIVSDQHKGWIVDAFTRCVKDPAPDIDRRLQQIRLVIEDEYADRYDHSLHLYEDEIRIQWDRGHTGYTGLTICADGPHNAGQGEDAETGIDLAALAASLYLDAAFLREVDILLQDKRQVIFQGPPGTGKTFVARALARHLAGGLDDRVTLAQFHPSYAYEDFVQGYRPAITDNGQAGFELRDGPLVRAAQRAESEPGARHFLVIDEINRGNLAKVFGELYFLLEYRDAKIDLQYGGERFSLPDNLYIIGTMNTADRSIALVDLALRRRFHFVEFHPDAPPIEGLLGRYLADKAVGMEWVADVVDRANELLRDDRNAAIGPSHFMKCGLDDDAVRRTWKYSVMPYIEERLLGDPQGRLDDFNLDTLRRQAMSYAAGEAADGANEFDGSPADADDESPTADA